MGALHYLQLLLLAVGGVCEAAVSHEQLPLRLLGRGRDGEEEKRLQGREEGRGGYRRGEEGGGGGGGGGKLGT